MKEQVADAVRKFGHEVRTLALTSLTSRTITQTSLSLWRRRYKPGRRAGEFSFAAAVSEYYASDFYLRLVRK